MTPLTIPLITKYHRSITNVLSYQPGDFFVVEFFYYIGYLVMLDIWSAMNILSWNQKIWKKLANYFLKKFFMVKPKIIFISNISFSEKGNGSW